MAYLIPFFRGLLAIGLGLVLLFWPEKSRVMLGNFMGVYWLMAGIVSLRWGINGRRARGLPMAAGIIGIIAGLMMLGRLITRNWLSPQLLSDLLGGVIVLTGLIHVFSGFRTGDDHAHQWSWSSFLLGLFEIILGVLLVLAPGTLNRSIYWAASIWALIGGALLIGDGLRLRQARKQKPDAKTDDVILAGASTEESSYKDD